MWYAVESVFVDGNLLGSKCCFREGDPGPIGHCFSLDAEPGNYRDVWMDGRCEKHIDWFESEELAHAFVEGRITYKHYYLAYYDASIRTTLLKFYKREIIPVDSGKGILPYRGLREEIMLTTKPVWVR